MTFWSLTNSDFPTDKTFHQFYDHDTELDLHRIMSGFHGAFATGVACQQKHFPLRAPGSMPFLGLAFALIVEFSDSIPLYDRTEHLWLYRTWLSSNWEVSMEHLGRVCQQGALTLPDTWFRPRVLETCLCSNCWDQILRTCQVFTRFFTLDTPW